MSDIKIGSKIAVASRNKTYICKVIEIVKEPLINGKKFDYIFIEEVEDARQSGGVAT